MDIRMTLEKYHMVQRGDLVIAAVSGGADSVCMLRLLLEAAREMDFMLAAVHVEHGIRGEESLADMRFTQELCETLGVPLRVCHVDVPGYAAEHGLGYEEAARQLRYEAFDRVVEEVRTGGWIIAPENGRKECMSGDKAVRDTFDSTEKGIRYWTSGRIHVALAHHAQDQAETVLFRLARGTGTEGMAGMRPVSSREVRKRCTEAYDAMSASDENACLHAFEERRMPIMNEVHAIMNASEEGTCKHVSDERRMPIMCEAHDIIRPMLYMSRDEIEHLLEKWGQAWCSDVTNQDISYARNRLRLRVMPELTKVNARAVEHIAQTAELLGQQQDYIAMEAAKALKRIGQWEGALQEGEEAQREAEGAQQKGEGTQQKGEGTRQKAERAHWESKGGQREMCLEIPGLLELHPALQREVLRQALMQVTKQRKDLTAGHVEQLLALTQKQSGSRLSLPYGVVAVREFSRIQISRQSDRDHCGRNDDGRDNSERDTAGRDDCGRDDSSKTPLRGQRSIDSGTITEIEIQKEQLQGLLVSGKTQIITLGEEERIELSVLPVNILSENCKKKYTKCFDYDMMIEGFFIRRRRAGDYLLMTSGHRKKLKQYLIEEKIPAVERQNLWLLAQDSCVLWVIGGRAGVGCEITENSRYGLCVSYRD